MDLVGFREFLLETHLTMYTIAYIERTMAYVLTSCPSFSEATFKKFLISKREEVSFATLNKYKQAAKWYCKYKQLEFDSSVFKKFKERPLLKATFSDVEIDALLAVPGTFFIALLLLAWTGARPKEIRSLRTEHFDFASGFIVLTQSKTGRGRYIALHPLIINQVREYVSTCNGYLFPSKFKKGEYITEAALRKEFNRRKQEVGITKGVLTSFRHSLATGVLNNDGNLLDTQDILGHSDPKTTRIYKRASYDSQIKALNHYPFIKNKLGDSEVIAIWEELRQKLLKMQGIHAARVTKLEELLHEVLERNPN